uniref:Reverse transcriptase domain-containing protein n=1 Tax=Cannabis sativa TaxID=3483 RepID=A0A803PM52_CANSA
MDPIVNALNTTLSLTEEEGSVFTLPQEFTASSSTHSNHMFIARVLTENYVHKLTFIDQMSGHWKGRFPAVISAYDSLDEGWGPFLRIRVKLPINKPLPRGRMISLPKVRDEFWIDFCYERLPEFCFECGLLGHPFEKCIKFMERMDDGNDDDLPYGPWLKGAKLPSTGYDKYHTDFAKGNAWPLLTRLARNTLTSTFPRLHSAAKPQPKSLIGFESPSTTSDSSLPNNTPILHHQHNPQSSTPFSPLPPAPTNFLSKSTQLLTPSLHSNSPTKTTLIDIYSPVIGFSSRPTYHVATYPPSLTSVISSPNPPHNRLSPRSQPIYTPSTSTTFSGFPPNPFSVTAAANKENLPPASTPKRHSDSLTMRQFLKRCRNQESPRSDLSGGLMLLWQPSIDVTFLLNFGRTFFDCYVKEDNEATFHFTAFYGAPNAIDKADSWVLLKRLADVSPTLPWLAIGDFNDILSNQDKSGGYLRNEKQMEAFRKTLDHCKLHETLFESDPYTWIKNRTGVDTIKERLDWCFINHLWDSTFNSPLIQHLDYFSSDHRAISAVFAPVGSRQQQDKRISIFRFEKIWLSDSQSKDIIASCWNTSSAINPIQAVISNLGECADHLQKWHISKYGNMRKKIYDAQLQVESLNNAPTRSVDTMQNLKRSEAILEDLLEQEKIYWHQRSRVDWLSAGDRNTKFFHAKASARKSNNSIKFLVNEGGHWVTSKSGMLAAIHDYFSSIFTASTLDEEALAATLNAIPTSVTADMNHELIKPFTGTEVEFALHSMAPDTSPGIDGMSPMFYQHNWDTVGGLITEAVLSVLNNGADATGLNRTLITLIPKIKKPQRLTDYRPISLCNVVSKLITKVLVNRFKHVLPSVISETQSAFLPNRLITDNILVAFELVNAIKNKTSRRNGIASLKLDMSKALDRVEWRFIEEVMTKMGFACEWITLIMNCLRTNSFSFLLNGEPLGSLIPSRGLRQGCPLSPYLFLICSEGLSRLLQHEETSGNLKGFKLTRHAPSISHLFFADDSLLFCQANESSCLALKRSLEIYKRASGQVLKSRYYPNNSILEANPGHSPSLTWQGIHWGKGLLVAGLRWKIGEGCRVNISRDPWMPGHSSFLPYHYSSPPEAVVSNLITDERLWDLDLLNEWFSPPDVDRILTIPLSFFRKDDVLIWNPNSSGIYTVQTGYHFAASLEDSDNSSSSSSTAAWWKFLWSLKLPEKIKIFVWRTFNEALPVATALVKQKVISDSTCSICHQAWESIGHALFRCKYARAVWRHSNFLLDWNNSSTMCKGDYLVHLSSIYTKVEMEQILCIMWSIWTERNRVVHGNRAKSAKLLSSFALNYWQNFSIAQQRHLSDHPPQNSGSPTAAAVVQPSATTIPLPWKPPVTGQLKLNVDAAVDSTKKITGIGALVRDSNGHVAAAFSKPVVGCFDSHEMEAIALFHSLNLVLQLQLPISQIETDALRVSNALCKPSSAISSFQDLIVDISSLLSFFPNVKISHVKRSANMAADCLAKFALGVDETCFWSDYLPPPMNSVIVNDFHI